jgi:hypothetical protein
MALRDVNLVPEQVLHRRYVIRHLYAWGGAYLLLFGILAGSYLGYTRVVLAQRNPAIPEEQLRKGLAVTITEIQRKTEELERLAFVRQASRSGDAPQVLGRLAEIMDPQVWLTDLTLQARETAGSTLLLDGLSVSNSLLGSLIKQLNDDPLFGKVVLKSADETQGSTGSDAAPTNLIRFAIAAETQTR